MDQFEREQYTLNCKRPNVGIGQMAMLLGTDRDTLQAELEKDGLLIGGTVTKKSRNLGWFWIVRGAYRSQLLHETLCKAYVTPKGQDALARRYNGKWRKVL